MNARKRVSAAIAGEPPYVRQAFERDPKRAARAVLRHEATDQARAGFETSIALRRAREATALHALAEVAGDGGTTRETAEAALRTVYLAAAAPALTGAEVAAKLALLLRDLMADGGAPSLNDVPRLLLAAGALADLVLLQDRPMQLPRDAAEPILDEQDVQRLRARAGRV